MERSVPQPAERRGPHATLGAIDGLLARVEIGVAAAALVIGLLVSLYAIGARALLRPTAEWVLELPMELLVVAAVYGSGALVSRRQHLVVDLVVERLPPGFGRAFTIVVDVTLALFCGGLAALAAAAAAQAWRSGLKNPELFNLSSAVPLAVASAGFALWSLHHALSLFARTEPEG